MSGRPSSYTDEIAEEICKRLADGESLRRICAAEDMPGRETVRRWMHEHETFGAKCARARELQAEHHHDLMDDIEDKVLEGTLEPAAANVVLANKRWRMAKLAPKVYGDKLDLNHSGKVIHTKTEMTDDELLAYIQDGGSPRAAGPSAGTD